MAESNHEFFGMWRPSSLPVLEKVQQKHVPVTLHLSHGFNGRSLAQQLKGTITTLTDSSFTYVITDQQTVPTTGPVKASQGSIVADLYFTLMVDKSDGSSEPIGYSGEVVVLKTIEGLDAQPVSVLLKVPHVFKTRRMRRDERYDWSKEIPATLGFDVVDFPPQNRLELKTILERCAENNKRFLFSPLNISAGGMCLLINPAVVRANPSSLYFFLLSLKPDSTKNAVPFFLLCKRLGLHYMQNSTKADGIRMQFVYELDWSSSQQQLKWTNIEKTGSSGLRSMLAIVLHDGTN
ncbi:MAG: hypothetical protein IJS50_04935 [Desulfovibrio sp.]|nr:hypothetical protein [Desulfovibrio sp.]